MRWQGKRGSSNLEDRRGMSGGKGIALGGGGIIVVILLALLSGKNPLELLGSGSNGTPFETAGNYQPTEHDNETVEFISVVLASTEEVWTETFNKLGRTYVAPKLVVFNGSISSACGSASSATGPFYCPADQKVYIDVSFYDELASRYKAAGDFAFAYVIAHEIGHHVQHLLGTLDKENAMRARASQTEANAISVRIELQADFYAGMWANHVRDMFELTDEDIREALNAAAAVGDDRLQQEAQGHVVPDAFTHGTSAQRQRWFFKGYQTGNIAEGDTFSAQNL